MTKLQEQLEAESMNGLEWQCQSQMNEDPIARLVSQVRVTMKHTLRKNSRTSSHEDKVEMEDITSKYKVVKLRRQENLEWNTGLIEMMELKHVMSHAGHRAWTTAKDATNLEKLKLREHEDVQWTKHASRSDSEAQQPDLTSGRGVLGECVYARCPHHKSTTTNTAQPQKVGALLPMPSCLGIGGHPSGSRQGHPRYTGARYNGEAVGGPHQRPKGEMHMP